MHVSMSIGESPVSSAIPANPWSTPIGRMLKQETKAEPVVKQEPGRTFCIRKRLAATAAIDLSDDDDDAPSAVPPARRYRPDMTHVAASVAAEAPASSTSLVPVESTAAAPAAAPAPPPAADTSANQLHGFANAKEKANEWATQNATCTR